MPTEEPHITFKIETKRQYRRRQLVRRAVACAALAAALATPATIHHVAPSFCHGGSLC